MRMQLIIQIIIINLMFFSNFIITMEPLPVKSLLQSCLDRIITSIDSKDDFCVLEQKFKSVNLPDDLIDRIRSELINRSSNLILKNTSYDCVDLGSKQLNSIAFNENNFAVVSYVNTKEKNNEAAIVLPNKIQSVLTGHKKEITAVAVSAGEPHEVRIATASKDKAAIIWDIWGKKKAKLIGHEDEISCITLTPSGKYAITGSKDKTVRIWNTVTGNCIACLYGHADTITAIAISLDESLIATGCLDNRVYLWDSSTGDCIKILEGHTDIISCIALSSFGDYVISGGGEHDKSVRCWDTKTGDCIKELEHEDAIASIAISIDNKFIITSSLDDSLKVWKTDTWDPITKIKFHGPSRRKRLIALNPSNGFFILCIEDQGLKTYDISKTLGEELYSKVPLVDLFKSFKLMKYQKHNFLPKEQQDKALIALEDCQSKKPVPWYIKRFGFLQKIKTQL